MATQNYWRSFDFYSILVGPFITQGILALLVLIGYLEFGQPIITLSNVKNGDGALSVLVIKNSGDSLYNATLSLDAQSLEITGNSGNATLELSKPPGYLNYIVEISNLRPHASETIILRSKTEQGIREIYLLKTNLINSITENITKYVPTQYPVAVLSCLVVNFIFASAFNIYSKMKDKNMEIKSKETEDRIESLRKDYTSTSSKLGAVDKENQDSLKRIKRYMIYFRRIINMHSRENEFWRRVIERIITNNQVSRNMSAEFISSIRKALGVSSKDKNTSSYEEETRSMELAFQILIDDIRETELEKLSKGD